MEAGFDVELEVELDEEDGLDSVEGLESDDFDSPDLESSDLEPVDFESPDFGAASLAGLSALPLDGDLEA